MMLISDSGHRRRLTAVRAGLGVDARVGKTQALDGPASYKVLLHNLRGVAGLHVAVPDGFGIDHYRGAMFALIQAERFVDANGSAESGSLGQLLQLGVEIAFAIGGAGWARRIGGTGIMADKDVAFERGQAVFLLGQIVGSTPSRVTGQATRN